MELLLPYFLFLLDYYNSEFTFQYGATSTYGEDSFEIDEIRFTFQYGATSTL